MGNLKSTKIHSIPIRAPPRFKLAPPKIPFWSKNSHLQTALGFLFPTPPRIRYQRERIDTSCGDFFDVDILPSPSPAHSLPVPNSANDSSPSPSPKLSLPSPPPRLLIDYHTGQATPAPYHNLMQNSVVIICNGLEAGSDSPHSIRLANTLNSQLGATVYVLNHRGCSGQPNRNLKAYHVGFYEDLEAICKKVTDSILPTDDQNTDNNKPYFRGGIFLAGYSLGANVILKFLGSLVDRQRQATSTFPSPSPALATTTTTATTVAAAAKSSPGPFPSSSSSPVGAFSSTLLYNGAAIDIPLPYPIIAAATSCVPFTPAICQPQLDRGFNKWVYAAGFLATLKKKAKRIHKAHPGAFDMKRVANCNTLGEFDDACVAPVFGFQGKDDYYQKCDAIPDIQKIPVPFIVIQAADDPIIPEKVFPLTNINPTPNRHKEDDNNNSHESQQPLTMMTRAVHATRAQTENKDTPQTPSQQLPPDPPPPLKTSTTTNPMAQLDLLPIGGHCGFFQGFNTDHYYLGQQIANYFTHVAQFLFPN